MKKVLAGAAICALLGAYAVSDAVAQAGSPDRGWWEWAAPAVVGGQQVPTRGGIVVVPEPRRDRGSRDSRARGRDRGRGEGPAFCRSGEGHPVHGRQWCIDKGWGLGGGVYGPRWERRRWEDIVFPGPRDRRRTHVDEPTLVDVLGSVVFGRLQDHRNQLGARDPITGRWITAGGGSVLQLRSGGVPIAELTDLDGDGRVDLVLVSAGR